jgi:hypothetical protein
MLVLFFILAVTVMIKWWSLIINRKGVVHIRRLKVRLGTKYTQPAWVLVRAH